MTKLSFLPLSLLYFFFFVLPTYTKLVQELSTWLVLLIHSLFLATCLYIENHSFSRRKSHCLSAQTWKLCQGCRREGSHPHFIFHYFCHQRSGTIKSCCWNSYPLHLINVYNRQKGVKRVSLNQLDASGCLSQAEPANQKAHLAKSTSREGEFKLFSLIPHKVAAWGSIQNHPYRFTSVCSPVALRHPYLHKMMSSSF